MTRTDYAWIGGLIGVGVLAFAHGGFGLAAGLAAAYWYRRWRADWDAMHGPRGKAG